MKIDLRECPDNPELLEVNSSKLFHQNPSIVFDRGLISPCGLNAPEYICKMYEQVVGLEWVYIEGYQMMMKKGVLFEWHDMATSILAVIEGYFADDEIKVVRNDFDFSRKKNETAKESDDCKITGLNQQPLIHKNR